MKIEPNNAVPNALPSDRQKLLVDVALPRSRTSTRFWMPTSVTMNIIPAPTPNKSM